MHLDTALLTLYHSGGWCELRDPPDWSDLKPYVERRRSVNQINENIEMYSLTPEGKAYAEKLLIKRGRSPIPDNNGVAHQRRAWNLIEISPHTNDELKDALETFRDWTDTPIDIHESGRVSFPDMHETITTFSELIGWERHRQLDVPLKRKPPKPLMWLWRHVLDELREDARHHPYQELVLWST